MSADAEFDRVKRLAQRVIDMLNGGSSSEQEAMRAMALVVATTYRKHGTEKLDAFVDSLRGVHSVLVAQGVTA